MDEQIIKELNGHKAVPHGNLQDGYYIKGELVQFKRTDLFDGKISIMLPDTFQDMPEDMARIKYPSGDRPQVIKHHFSTGMDFCFNKLAYTNGVTDANVLANTFQSIISTVNPSLFFYEPVQNIEDAELPTSWFHFQSFALDGKMYNIVYIVALKDCYINGVFNCGLGDKDYWSEVVIEVMKSIIEN